VLFKDLFNKLFSENTDTDSFTMYHGGTMNQSDYTPIKGRWEYGPGLYLTNSYSLARDYGKGSRKVYKCKILKGNEISNCYIPTEKVSDFIKLYGGKHKKDYQSFLPKHNKDGMFPASVLVNLAINNDMKSSSAKELKKFLVENEVDYDINHWSSGDDGTYILTLYNDSKLLEFKPIKSVEVDEYLTRIPH
jgi:hypothetical protein